MALGEAPGNGQVDLFKFLDQNYRKFNAEFGQIRGVTVLNNGEIVAVNDTSSWVPEEFNGYETLTNIYSNIKKTKLELMLFVFICSFSRVCQEGEENFKIVSVKHCDVELLENDEFFVERTLFGKIQPEADLTTILDCNETLQKNILEFQEATITFKLVRKQQVVPDLEIRYMMPCIYSSLILNGADSQIRNKDHASPQHLAAEIGDEQIIEICNQRFVKETS